MRIEIDSERDLIIVDGVKIALELLKVLAQPDPTVMYRLVRQGDSVTVERVA